MAHKVAHKRPSRIGSQDEPKQDAQRWFLRSFERCNTGLLDALEKGRPLVAILESNGCAAIWSKLERHAEWVSIAPEHAALSTQYPGRCSPDALALHAFLTDWASSLREAPAWFIASALSSLRTAVLADSPLRLHLCATVYGPLHQPLAHQWLFLGPNGDPREVSAYVERESVRFRRHLERIAEEVAASVATDPEVIHIPKPEAGKPKMSFDWAALMVAGHTPEQIAVQFTDRDGSDGKSLNSGSGAKKRAPEIENVRRLSRKVLAHVDWPLTTRTKSSTRTPKT